MNMKQLQTLILISLSLLVILLIGSQIMNYQALGSVNLSYREIVETEVPKLDYLQGATRESSNVQRSLLNIVLENDASHIQEYKARLIKARQASSEYFEKMEKHVRSEEGRRLLSALKEVRSDYNRKGDQLIEIAAAGKTQEAHAFNANTVRPAFTQYQDLLNQLADQNVRFAQEKSAEATAQAERAQAKSAMIGTIGAILGILGAGWSIWSLRKSIGTLTTVSQSIGEASEQTASASGQVSASSQSLAEGASEQAASLEETSSSLEEMSSMTRRNSENAQNAKDLANQARTAADTGVQEMAGLSTAMKDIQSSGNEISAIIKTIDEIAFQTNILALNAAVEAARAGEHGLGFAVVADEVRNLAQRAAAAARETAEKIDAAIQKTQHGASLTERVAKSLNQIVDRAKQVDQLVAEIALASTEQNKGVDQINMAVGQMDKVTQTSAANAEETAAASEQLNAQARVLQELAINLNQLVGTSTDKSSVKTTVSTPTPREHIPLPTTASRPTSAASRLQLPMKHLTPAATPKSKSTASADFIDFDKS